MNITDTLLLALDTETTGPDPATARIVELGYVFLHGHRTGPPTRLLFNPGTPIPPEVTEIHGIRDDDVRDAPPFEEAAWLLQAQVTVQVILVGYNILHYDGPLINAELERAGLAWRLPLDRMLDPIVWLRWKHRTLPSRKLGAVCAKFGVRLTQAHSAAADATAAGELLLALVQTGDIPDDLDEALSLQAAYRLKLDAEREAFGYFLYRDRVDGETLRVGFGKYNGALLSAVPKSYLEYILGVIMPPGVRKHLEAAVQPAGTQHVPGPGWL